MSKAVLISIRPEWCEKILSGKKTVEIRKTRPQLDAPFKCYIYCTKASKGWVHLGTGERLDGHVIAEFTCKRIDAIYRRGVYENFDYCYLSLNEWGNDDIETEITDIKKSCVKKQELNGYGGEKGCLYAWHISNLKVYEKPKEITDFAGLKEHRGGMPYIMKRPPQSWCYVEEAEE